MPRSAATKTPQREPVLDLSGELADEEGVDPMLGLLERILTQLEMNGELLQELVDAIRVVETTCAGRRRLGPDRR